MKGLVLAAGKGTRLRPLTDNRAKPLVKIAGRPILQYNFENLRDAGVREIVVVVNGDGAQIEEYFGDGEALGVRLTYVMQHELLGTAHAVYQAKDAIGNHPFVLVFGDNMTGYRLVEMVEHHRRFGGGSVLAVATGCDPRKHAVVGVEGERVVSIEERPPVARSPYTSAGMFVFEHSIFEAIEHVKPVANGEYYLPHAVQWLIEQGYPVSYTLAQSWRVNINTPGDMLSALPHVLADRAESTPAENALRRGEVELGAGVRLQGKVSLEPYTYVGDYCQIGSDSRIANSLLMEHVTIGSNCSIANAILGRGAVVPDGHCIQGNGVPVVIADGSVVACQSVS